ncbi:ferric reductase-like transmembrane domain-containing protein [Tateyamaria sp.]|uniref:ferric reductase-like transmembrane domain-containing protein n=1 Tax=Tateyamaria sp. TaxID=1929288 RepID=UPI00329E9370
MRTALIWIALALALGAPLVAAGFSPQLQWRSGIYIASGFAGILAMCLLLIQPLLAAGDLPPLGPSRSRKVHRAVGALLLLAVLGHIVGLWLTSPPDVVDALLLSSPTPFSLWGVIAMWAVFGAALMASLRRRLRFRPMTWRRLHVGLAVIIATTTVAHAALIDGTMELTTKVALSVLVLAATTRVAYLTWRMGRKRGPSGSR